MDTTLIQAKLTTKWCGRSLHFMDSVGSTNDWAREDHSAGRGSVYAAGYQKKGRGRLERNWESPAGKNILLTLVDASPDDPSKAYQLTLVAGLAAAHALKLFAGPLQVSLKWPNDIYLQNKKCGGILSEFVEAKKLVLVGLGLNINAALRDFSPKVQKTATSLSHETKKQFPLENIIIVMLQEYETWRERYQSRGMEPIIEEWNLLSVHQQKKLRVNDGQKTFDGTDCGLNRDGFLQVRVGTKIETVVAGDIQLLS